MFFTINYIARLYFGWVFLMKPEFNKPDGSFLYIKNPDNITVGFLIIPLKICSQCLIDILVPVQYY